MKEISLEAFKASCQKKRCLRNTMITPQCPKEYKQEQCFSKFVQKQEKDKAKQEIKYKEQKEKSKEIEVDEKWVAVQKEVWVRDGGKCRFSSTLDQKTYIECVKPHLWGDLKRIDCAHILPRSTYPSLKYNSSNIVLLYRCIHTKIDNFIDPLTNKPMTKEEHETWWRSLVGDELYDDLLRKGRSK